MLLPKAEKDSLKGKTGLLADTHFEEFLCGIVSRSSVHSPKYVFSLKNTNKKIKLIRAKQLLSIHTVIFNRHLVLLTYEIWPRPATIIISIAQVLEYISN